MKLRELWPFGCLLAASGLYALLFNLVQDPLTALLLRQRNFSDVWIMLIAYLFLFIFITLLNIVLAKFVRKEKVCPVGPIFFEWALIGIMSIKFPKTLLLFGVPESVVNNFLLVTQNYFLAPLLFSALSILFIIFIKFIGGRAEKFLTKIEIVPENATLVGIVLSIWLGVWTALALESWLI